MDSHSGITATSGELTRNLSFRDVFFLSFGGMSPLLSLLTYGAVALAFGGPLAPLIMVMGTLLVLVNGLVVMQLSKRFRTSGGYYTYAFQVLSERVGFSTGWVYLFYSMLFGMAYVIGAVFVVSTVIGLPSFITLMAIVIPASAFLIAGIRPSAKYAVYTGIVEIALILVIVAISFYLTGGAAYIPNPAVYHITGGELVLGILFAMGIPTGYGAIAPISGEVKNSEKVIGKSAVSVILVGGLLATLFIYGISNLLLQEGLKIPAGVSGLPILSAITHDFSAYGGYLTIAVTVAALNDGILAILSFGAAASRTMFRMGYDRSFPSIFATKIRNQPIVANIAVSVIILSVPLVLILNLPLTVSFIILGTIASLGGLFIHIMAGASLMRVGMRRGKRLVLRGPKDSAHVLYDYREAVLAVVAATITTVELVYSAYSTLLVYSALFLLWIVAGYMILDVRDIVTRTPYTARLFKGELSMAERFKDLTSLKIRRALPDVVVQMDENLKSAVDRCVSLDAQGAAVIDSRSNPVGTMILRDVFLLSENEIMRMKVGDLWLERPVTIGKDSDVTEIIRTFKESRMPILSIVDENGKLVGTVREREVLMALGGGVEGSGSTEAPAS